jgi:DNA gyrase subunit B (EC 5.99.1.3)
MGEPVEDLKQIGKTDETGTSLRFKPSGETFNNIEFHFELLAKKTKRIVVFKLWCSHSFVR